MTLLNSFYKCLLFSSLIFLFCFSGLLVCRHEKYVHIREAKIRIHSRYSRYWKIKPNQIKSDQILKFKVQISLNQTFLIFRSNTQCLEFFGQPSLNWLVQVSDFIKHNCWFLRFLSKKYLRQISTLDTNQKKSEKIYGSSLKLK